MSNIQCPRGCSGMATRVKLGCWTLDIGYWTLDIGYWTLDVGHWTLDIGHSFCSSFFSRLSLLMTRLLPVCRAASRFMGTVFSTLILWMRAPPTRLFFCVSATITTAITSRQKFKRKRIARSGASVSAAKQAGKKRPP